MALTNQSRTATTVQKPDHGSAFGDLQSIEADLRNVLDKLHVPDISSKIVDSDNWGRRKKLLKLTINTLQRLYNGESVGGISARSRDFDTGPGSPSNALSLNEPSYAGKDALADYMDRFR